MVEGDSMLNELYKLSETLKEHEIEQQVWNDEYNPLPGGQCYRIWLQKSGIVDHIEIMNKELVACCRKYGNNQQSFPSFNISSMYRISSKVDKEYYDKLYNGKEQYDIERLKAICLHDNWNSKLLKKTSGCLHKVLPNMPIDSGMAYLMDITKEMDGALLRKTIETCVWTRISEDIKAYLPILLHKGNEKKEADEDTGSLSIFLDFVDWELFGYPIGNVTTTEQVNKWLQAGSVYKVDGAHSYDAFGKPYVDVGKSMPSVRIAPGFEVVLRSMFRDQACQYRYGKADDFSFPISAPVREDTKTSLEWIAKADNEKRTWRKIDNDAMLFVYPDKLPKYPPMYASLFGGNDQEAYNESVQDGRFEEVANRFISVLDAIKPNERPDNIQVFVLQQMKPALSKRAKVVFTRNLSVNGLLESADQWWRGCNNIPDISYAMIKTPFPLSVYKTANQVWKLNGEKANGKNAVKIMMFYQGMEIFLDSPMPSQLLRILHGILKNYLGLVLFLGNAMHRQKQVLKASLKEDAGNMFSLLGLLLYKLGARKEDYMKETAYSLGQVLKISDELHSLYCEVKRDGDIPPQLVGNSVLVTASDMPVRALALLMSRMNPYISWAKQYRSQEKDKSRLAAWFLKQYESLMPLLHSELTEQIRFSDVDKAQLFIGYLSALPKSENKKTTEEENKNHEQ